MEIFSFTVEILINRKMKLPETNFNKLFVQNVCFLCKNMLLFMWNLLTCFVSNFEGNHLITSSKWIFFTYNFLVQPFKLNEITNPLNWHIKSLLHFTIKTNLQQIDYMDSTIYVYYNKVSKYYKFNPTTTSWMVTLLGITC